MINDPLEVCGPADFVYVSHIHPDHFDSQFLKEYLAKYPTAKVLISDQTPDLLGRKLRSRGITPLVGYQRCGETELYPEPNRANHGVNIDSALVVRRGDLSVVNLNDNPFDQQQIDNLLAYCPGRKPTVALLPFVGAGPWPQCYKFDRPEDQLKAAEAKKQKYLDTFARYCQALQPQVAIPFAGQYWTHGPNLDLNPLRGMADATECKGLEYLPVNAGEGLWVPADGGQSVLTVEENGTTWWNSERKEPYDWPTVREKLQDMHALIWSPHLPRASAYRYEREIHVPVARLPLLKLLQSAAPKAHQHVAGRGRLWVCVHTTDDPSRWFLLQTHEPTVTETDYAAVCTVEPRYEVRLDPRALFSMLTRLANANSLRIGSICRFRVVPMEPFNELLYDLFGDWWDSLRV
jgi:UDP-MurNAc hydroxylase